MRSHPSPISCNDLGEDKHEEINVDDFYCTGRYGAPLIGVQETREHKYRHCSDRHRHVLDEQHDVDHRHHGLDVHDGNVEHRHDVDRYVGNSRHDGNDGNIGDHQHDHDEEVKDGAEEEGRDAEVLEDVLRMSPVQQGG